MGQEVIWRSPSLEGKWKDGRGDIVVSRVDYFDMTWLDLRIVRIEDGVNQHTRQGLRLTYEQLKELSRGRPLNKKILQHKNSHLFLISLIK